MTSERFHLKIHHVPLCTSNVHRFMKHLFYELNLSSGVWRSAGFWFHRLKCAVLLLAPLRFGWTADQIAVIPRLTADIKCGKGKTGVVTWATSEDQKFGVFCFDASGAAELKNLLVWDFSLFTHWIFYCSHLVDFEASSDKPTVVLQSSTCASTLASLLQTSTSAEPPLTSSTRPPSPRTTTGPETPLTPAFNLLFKAATSTVVPLSSTPAQDFSTHDPTSVTQLITSTPALLSSSSSTSVQHNLSAVSDSAVLPSTNAPEASLAGTPPSLISAVTETHTANDSTDSRTKMMTSWSSENKWKNFTTLI